jgi:hypothetical protein
MLILQDQSDTLEAVLGSAVTSTELSCVSSSREISNSTYSAKRDVVTTNGATAVTIVSAPTEGSGRVVDYISIYNLDTASAVVTVQLNASTVVYVLWKGTLLPNEKVEYIEGIGFQVLNSGGVVKQSTVNTLSPVSNSIQTVVLANDFTNNDATLNTIKDVTGMAVPVVTGSFYWFRFVVFYMAQATSTGSRWSVTTPAFSQFGMNSWYTLTATTNTLNNIIAGDVPAGSNATSLGNGTTTGNMAVLEGFILPSADGNVQLRMASEIANSAITAKKGSKVDYQTLY